MSLQRRKRDRNLASNWSAAFSEGYQKLHVEVLFVPFVVTIESEADVVYCVWNYFH